jgi:formylglycine-generating enzyme required for sulfatase activity/tRNA A-37 threonylcarbamoyl transferase component Bud32
VTVEGSTTPPSQPPLDPLGARLQAALGDAYAVEGQLGAGGFAVVYLVRDVHLKRKLAAKVLSPDVISSHSVLERFRREAETVAQLSHPHIVPLHFIGQKDDLVYLIMEAIDGGSLADRLEREKQLPIDEAARIFGEVASALAHAHKRGVVHRDIKPQNVLMDTETGRSLVTDFGIARTSEGGSLTATGMVIGTPAYLSPEQVTGEPSDHRADIYALGVMMYEMLAGQPPFTGPTPTAVLMKRLAGPPEPLRKIRADVPEALSDIVDACLATDPNERLGNAADIVRALTGHSPVSGGHTTGARIRVQKPKQKSKTMLFGTIAVLLVAAVAIGVMLSNRTSTVAPAVASRPQIDSGMVLIPAGTYVIGNNDEEGSRPAHSVPLPAFGIGTHEVTVAEYNRFVATGRVAAPWTTLPADTLLPVSGVRLTEAQNYCAWRHPDGGRLPTEEEWEAAARGFSSRRYPWGADWNAQGANVGGARTGPVAVGSHPAGRTPDGIHDMIGNVWEWTSSPYRPYNSSAAGEGFYVIRGAGYSALRNYATASFRGRADPATSRNNLAATGFRCAMNARASGASATP